VKNATQLANSCYEKFRTETLGSERDKTYFTNIRDHELIFSIAKKKKKEKRKKTPPGAQTDSSEPTRRL
jgi:hypothetical protein